MAQSPELDLTAVEEALLRRRDELAGRIGGLAKAPERHSGISFGKRIGDGTIEAVSRLTDIGVGRNLERAGLGVDRALAKLAEGTYGACDACGDAIPAGRLRARPESVLCVSCAQRAPR